MKHLYTTIISSVITAFISSIITLILGSSIYYFNKEQINISISESTNIDNQYITSLSIKNYESNKAIDEINLWFKDVKVLKIDSDLQNSYSEEIQNIKLSNIIPEYKGTIILYTDKGINENNLKVETKLKNNIIFLGKQEESAYINIKNYLILAFIYFVELAFINIVASLKMDKKLTKNLEEVNEVKYKQFELNRKLDKAEENIREINQKYKKNEIKFIKIIGDYSKELNFWKDTVRKLLYKAKDKKIEKNDIFKEVTYKLKTFHTLDKCSYNNIYELLDYKEENKE